MTQSCREMPTREQERPPVHPGRALRRVLEDAGLTPSSASAALGVPVSRLTGIPSGKRAVSADTALRLSRYFGTSAQMWLNMRTQYHLEVAEEHAGRIARPTRSRPPALIGAAVNLQCRLSVERTRIELARPLRRGLFGEPWQRLHRHLRIA